MVKITDEVETKAIGKIVVMMVMVTMMIRIRRGRNYR